MEILFVLWLHDKRWLFGWRPRMKIFALFWIIPIICNMSLLLFNGRFMYTNDILFKFDDLNVILGLKLFLCLFSIICCFIIIKDIYKNQSLEDNILEAFFERAKIAEDAPKPKNIDEYWTGRNTLCSCNGAFIIIIGILQFLWAMYYSVRNVKSKIDNDKKFTLILDHLIMADIAFTSFSICFFFLTAVIKVTSFISAYTCPSLANAITSIFSSKMKYVDFNGCLEPEFKEVVIENRYKDDNINEEEGEYTRNINNIEDKDYIHESINLNINGDSDDECDESVDNINEKKGKDNIINKDDDILIIDVDDKQDNNNNNKLVNAENHDEHLSTEEEAK